MKKYGLVRAWNFFMNKAVCQLKNIRIERH